MKVIIVPKGFDFAKLREVTFFVASVGSLVAAWTEHGLYITHIDRVAEHIDPRALPPAPPRRRTVVDADVRAVIAKLADEGMTIGQIAEQLGIGYKTAQRHHPHRSYASQSR